ncbi:uncharacterized protein L3040_002180 [Drepanopeziza brunnea f. sp. 'multigermtubi']|uniref:DnaJ domain-containing protein n=1 Tax=Marssonina brunnea f. sp. multigermtubi (strain MB_m1) TaxID=1072389 RepID=K1XYB5_MARBU|nr:DnaJ domain-containing protein [Drepanopeziza brunnea f. sp. 'multigermtubi' MB_m1]EKD17809.1 DnaJ domain-containing protein [Drepanopeziza brunnea f. sp. 'multigermtubi' MB_m1]KAJ5052431.1 hypothetical protein L3040_002180 [Drepanopeziza brunnea f. sp. 'multigermtubi']
MVKADLTRDYYGDLDLPPTAEVHEIKKQFKKLALTYHPDRNPGRESEVTAKFQKIQSAHEVLIDPQERARYDANKIRPSRYGGQSSGVRGNPWANAASAYPPPPRAPTAKERQRDPPPSTGARRYGNFTTPQQSAYAASQEGPQARKDTYTAWEHLRHQHGASDPKPGPGKTWKAPEPPPRGTPQSGREESNAKRHGPPPKAGPSYQEFREFRDREANTPRRSQSTSAGNKKNGFMPNTPGGGDEPPAPMGAYFTDRNKPSVAPELPPREPRPQRQTRPVPDPLAQFKDKAMAGEPRISTPYSTHGGEKFDPFESTNVNRSKSTRERPQQFDGDFMPRAGSDSNMSSVEKARAYAQRHSPKAPKPAEPPNHDGSSSESSSDGFVKMNAPASGTTHRAPSSQGPFDASTQPNTNSKQSERARLRQWMLNNPGQEPPPDGLPDGPVPRSSRPQTQQQPQNNGDTMYANSDSLNPDRQSSKVPNFSIKLPTVSECLEEPAARGPLSYKKPTKYFMDDQPAVTPDAQTLNAFEGLQRSLVDQLLHNKRTSSLNEKSRPSPGFAETPVRGTSGRDWTKDRHYQNQTAWQEYRDPSSPGSPSKKLKPAKHLHSVHPYDFAKSREFWDELDKLKKSQANYPNRTSSFSFNVNDDMFSQARQQSNGFSNSADNISTKFTPEDWDGKFEAGADYFKPKPEQQKTRTQSASRPRGRSPVKARPIDPKFPQPGDSDNSTESPSGAKFSADEWKETFKPQTFMPPPPRMASTPSRKRTGPALRPTMGGNAAVVSDGDSSDDKPLFAGRKNMASGVGSPEPMDVDTPPANNPVPQYTTTTGHGHLKVNNESSKRSASTSASQSRSGTEDLNVEFDDLHIRDLMSSMAMPAAPQPPDLPEVSSQFELPSRIAYDEYVKRFAKYMTEWDLFNSKFLLHMVARKNQIDNLKERRWTDEAGTEIYRIGLKEDQAVLKRWTEFQQGHETVIKAFIVVRERMKNRDEHEGPNSAAQKTEQRVRPRKKTH